MITDLNNHRIKQEALDWYLRIHSPSAAVSDFDAFTLWLEANDQHRMVYDRLEDQLMAIEDIVDRQALIAELETSLKPLAAFKSDHNVVDASDRFSRRRFIAGITALAASVAIGFQLMPLSNNPIKPLEYMTAKGEQRSITLADGSQVLLNSDSKIRVAFEENARKTELLYGQAKYSIAKDKDRPFTIDTGDRTVRVVGTVFDVLRHNKETRVTVSEGVVEVKPNEHALATAAERLTQGMQLTHHDGALKSTITNVNLNQAMSWQYGQLTYQNAALKDVIADLGRYFDTRIGLSPALNNSAFSGVLLTNDLEANLALLESSLSIKVKKEADRIYLEAAKN